MTSRCVNKLVRNGTQRGSVPCPRSHSQVRTPKPKLWSCRGCLTSSLMVTTAELSMCQPPAPRWESSAQFTDEEGDSERGRQQSSHPQLAVLPWSLIHSPQTPCSAASSGRASDGTETLGWEHHVPVLEATQ